MFRAGFPGILPVTGKGSSIFSPSDISDLALWLDASDASTITEDVGVSVWVDKSENGRDIANTTGTEQPLIGSVQINGLDTVTFDGTDDILYNASPFMYDEGALTIFAVIKGAAQEDNRIIAERGGGFYAPFQTRRSSNFDQLTAYIKSTTTTLYDNSTAGTSLFDDTPKIGVSVDTGSAIINYANGGTGTSHSYTRSGVFTFDNFAVGAVKYVGSEASHFAGDIGEVVIFGRVLNDTEKNLIGNYLASKWGVSWTPSFT